MQIGDRFIGRDRELSQLELAIGPGTDGLRLSMLRGPSGLGKTTLSHVAMEKARERGFQVRIANGRAGSLSTPFAPWLEAIPELTDIIANNDSEQTRDIEQIGVALVTLLHDLASEQPLLLVFDDSQALDESSIALLPYTAGVSERANISVMFVEQTDAIDVSASYRSFVDGILARRIVQHLELGPMTDESITELVRSVLEVGTDGEVPTEVVIRAQGNPWFAKELSESFRSGATEVPVSIAAAATGRLHRLDDTSKDLVFGISLCPEGAHIGWLESLADQKPRMFVRTMEAIKQSGVIREDAEFVSIAHPLMRQALLGELSSAMRRALHMELAEVIADTPVSEIIAARAQGYHLSQAGKADEAVNHYQRAAEANEIVGQLHEAFADFMRALEAEPRIDNRIALLKACALRAVQLSDDRAVELWSELGRIAATKNDNDLYAYALFQQYWTSYDGTAVDRLERAAQLGPDQYGWSARAAAYLKTQITDYEGAIEHDLRALELARETDDGMLETLALEKIGMAYLHLGDLDKAIGYLNNAVGRATAQRLHNWAITAWGSLTEALTENLETDRALQECESALKYVTDLGLERYQAIVQSLLARRLLRSGRLDEACNIADQAVGAENKFRRDLYSAYIALNRAEVVVEAGDTSSAIAAVETALEFAQSHGYQSWIFDAQLEQAKLLSRTGKLQEAIELAQSLEVDEPTSMVTLALWFARIGMHYSNDHALQLAGRASAGLEGGPLIALMKAEIDAIVSSPEAEQVDALCAVADRWNAASRPLDALRALTSMGIAQLKLGKVKEAIETLTTARVGFAKCGASNDADFVAGQLRALGTRSRAKSRSTTVGNLTKRELEIARLVATGMRNSEVAGQLFLAEKTVAAHLSNIYGKLEVRSRVQLAAWLKEHDDADITVAS